MNKQHPLYQAIMYQSLGIGTKGMMIVLCALFDRLSAEEKQQILADINKLVMSEKA